MRIPMEDWLRGCAYHDGRHGEVTLSTDKVIEVANYIQLTRTSLADGMIEIPPYDRKTEPSNSENPNNSTISKMEQVDKDINVRSKDEPHIVGKHADVIIIDESQAETEIAKAIVHKMIDDAVIAEDAYPDLRQKMHDAVDEYEPQAERSE